MNGSIPDRLGEIEQQAAEYLAALVDDPSNEISERLANWIARDPAHAVAYARAEAAWEAAARLKGNAPSAIDEPGEPDEPQATAAPAPVSQPYRPTRRHVLAGGAIAASVAAIATVSLRPRGDRLETRVGEIRDVRLPDGSLMHLNTASDAEIAYSKDRRLIRLDGGEAFFQVAHNAEIPFDVRAQGAIIRALGTAFNVRLREDLVELTVTEGLVGVHSAKGAAYRVAAGESAFIQASTVNIGAIGLTEIDQRIAWRNRFIELDGETLVQAVEEFNRYRTQRLIIGDQRIGGLRVGGRFSVDQSDQFIKALTQSLPVRAVTGDDGRVLLLYHGGEDGDAVLPEGEPGEAI